jgi:hypothetical protein
MKPSISELIRRIRALEEELEAQLALARADLQVRMEGGRIAFEQAVRRRHAAMRPRLLRYVLARACWCSSPRR